MAILCEVVNENPNDRFIVSGRKMGDEVHHSIFPNLARKGKWLQGTKGFVGGVFILLENMAMANEGGDIYCQT